MDHLLVPPGGIPIRVPYKCREEYDRQDFLGYPQRKGWTEEHLRGAENFGGRSAAEVESFFQSWLYFGTLISVFKLGHIKVKEPDFITTGEHGTFLTTNRLPSKILAWKAKCQNKEDSGPAWTKTKKIFGELCTYIDRYCGIEGREHVGIARASTTPAVAWPVSEEISLAIIALGHILRKAAIEIYRPNGEEQDNRWGASNLLKKRLIENGWCRMDVRRLLSDMRIDGHYYLALQRCPQGLQTHWDCSETLCLAGNVDEKRYVTRHVDNCGCNGDEHGTATSEVVGIIEDDRGTTEGEIEGGIPVLSWWKVGESSQPRFIVDNARSRKTKYVAISHVWSDGLGNPHENSLPKCQLFRLQKLANALYPDEMHPVRFWMDTLCVPVGEEHRDLRKRSIRLMREIYQSASSVLVLDSGIQQLSLSTTLAERAMRIYLSNWTHRLWTFQEGMLAKKLYFQLSDHAQLKDDFTDQCWEDMEESKAKGVFVSFPSDAQSAALGHYTIMKDFVNQQLAGPSSLFPALTHAIQHRATTKRSDETICAATILRLDTEPLLEKKADGKEDEDEVADQRMEIFLEQIGGFPQGIIFHRHRRLQRSGFRWAPGSLMGARPGDLYRDLNVQTSPFEGKGLPVRYPGIKLGYIEHYPEKIQVVPQDGRWCSCSIQLFPNEGALRDPESDYLNGKLLAVVMMRPLSIGSLGTDAIVGVLEDPNMGTPIQQHKLEHSTVQEPNQEAEVVKPLNATVALRYQCRAWVEPLEDFAGWVSRCQNTAVDSTVQGEFLGETQKWLVL